MGLGGDFNTLIPFSFFFVIRVETSGKPVGSLEKETARITIIILFPFFDFLLFE